MGSGQGEIYNLQTKINYQAVLSKCMRKDDKIDPSTQKEEIKPFYLNKNKSINL